MERLNKHGEKPLKVDIATERGYSTWKTMTKGIIGNLSIPYLM
jgi:hypothetical protein